MSKKSSLFRKATFLPLVVGLTLVMIWLVVSATDARATQSPDETAVRSQQPSFASSAISGTVIYSGEVTGTHAVWVGAFTTTLGVPPAYATMRSGPGPYTLTVEAGTYHIYAGMDVDDSGGPPDPAHDPMGAYAGNPVTITAGAAITGLDITLLDPGPPPTDRGSISGWISYTGRITTPHNIIVFAGQQGGEGPPAYAAVIFGTGFYTIPNVPDHTYTVGAFMDLGGDMGPPEPDEPFGWYDLGGDGQPDPVLVSESHATTGIDITLYDPRRSIHLPLVLKAY
jgi:hypothetical protein